MIHLYNVFKSFGGDVHALRDVNLHVGKGEFVFVTGPSGAGKTTLLKLVFCAEKPTSGQIVVLGRNTSRLSSSSIPFLRRNVGVVFQDFKLIASRSVFENVAFTLEVLGTPPSEIKRRVLLALRSVGLIHKIHNYPPSLSGGEQQRVAMARALINEPSILLADEPTGNLDPDLTIETMKLLETVNARGTTVVVATHDRNLIGRFPRRTLTLAQGRIASDTGQG